MATATIDGIIEEAAIKRRRTQGSFHERIRFRLDAEKAFNADADFRPVARAA